MITTHSVVPSQLASLPNNTVGMECYGGVLTFHNDSLAMWICRFLYKMFSWVRVRTQQCHVEGATSFLFFIATSRHLMIALPRHTDLR